MNVTTDALPHSNRRGITLLETLIAMFVALVGLSGLAALFWLGGVEMSEGVKLDRAMSVARAGQRAVKIYGMLRPIQTYTTTSGSTATTQSIQTWVAPPTTLATAAPITGQFVDSFTPSATAGNPPTIAPIMPFVGTPTSSPKGYFGASPNNLGYGDYTQGFAIDPLGVLANQLNNADSASNPIGPAFPAVDCTGVAPVAITYSSTGPLTSSTHAPSQPCLTRVTLMAQPLLSGQTTPTLWSPGSTPGTTQTYSAGQADLIFRSGDDLLLNNPNGDFPPTQQLSHSGRRQSQGDYSWLATVVPCSSNYELYTPPSGPPKLYIPSGDPNLVRVSVVVFYKRVPLVSIDSTGSTAPSERMVTANIPSGVTNPNGVGGGDVVLSANVSSYLNLKAGQWIMLSQTPTGSSYNVVPPAVPPVGTILPQMGYWCRWYKVAGAGPITQNGGTFTRNVTLSGPDWNPGAALASIFDGAVAVYEKEISLEATGAPWAPN